jgi:hypothetical protein
MVSVCAPRPLPLNGSGIALTAAVPRGPVRDARSRFFLRARRRAGWIAHDQESHRAPKRRDSRRHKRNRRREIVRRGAGPPRRHQG